VAASNHISAPRKTGPPVPDPMPHAAVETRRDACRFFIPLHHARRESVGCLTLPTHWMRHAATYPPPPFPLHSTFVSVMSWFAGACVAVKASDEGGFWVARLTKPLDWQRDEDVHVRWFDEDNPGTGVYVTFISTLASLRLLFKTTTCIAYRRELLYYIVWLLLRLHSPKFITRLILLNLSLLSSHSYFVLPAATLSHSLQTRSARRQCTRQVMSSMLN